MWEGQLPESAVARIAVELLPPAGGVPTGDQPSRHEPEDAAIDLVVDGVAGVFRPRADEQMLVGREVLELGGHVNRVR
jgi:hypothetical protein